MTKLNLAVAQEVGQFGIAITLVEPGFFQTDLLDARNVRYAESAIDDYAAEGTAEAMWSPYDGKQTGDPDKLGEALVVLSKMSTPPRVFAAGADALEAIRPVLEGRMADMRAHEALTRAM